MTSVKNQILQEFGRELGKYKIPKESKEASLEHKREYKEHSVQFKNRNQTKKPRSDTECKSKYLSYFSVQVSSMFLNLS